MLRTRSDKEGLFFGHFWQTEHWHCRLWDLLPRNDMILTIVQGMAMRATIDSANTGNSELISSCCTMAASFCSPPSVVPQSTPPLFDVRS